MAFTFRETEIVKGMLARGDKQHDIASFFGVNGGRVAEVATDRCDYPSAQPATEDRLPPPGPYVGAKTIFEVTEILEGAIDLFASAGDATDESQIANDALNATRKKIS